jgi:dTDP-4-amino-4,6-dideoxygalactose transaminase
MKMKEKLAIRGGKPAVPDELKKPWPIITDRDINEIVKVLKSGVLGGIAAPQALALEKEYAEYSGAKYALAVNSGTAALHCAAAAAGVGPGDEVITSAYTFLASASAVLHHNGIPVFVDIEPDTFTIDPSKIEEKITEKTKAIMPVHIHGLPADMDPILRIARRHNLKVIEDAAQAHGATYKGNMAGTLGDIAGFSLQTTKNLCAGEGGLVTTNDAELRDRASLVRMFGELVQKDRARSYNAYVMGWNYRIPEMSASLARTQLTNLDEYNRVIRENAEYLSSQLRQIEGLIPPYVPADRTSTYYLYRVKVDPEPLGLDIEPGRLRMAVQDALMAEGVEVMGWQNVPVAGQAIFQFKTGYGQGCPWSCPHARGGIEYRITDYPRTLDVLDTSFHVSHVYPPNDQEVIDSIVHAFHKVMGRVEEVIDHFNMQKEFVPIEERAAKLVDL